jgi:DNA/RNA endonuclease YhcR with UshA esterase domain
MSHCPSCGRYVGPHGDGACPYCGACLTRRISIRAIKLSAVLLATVGLAVLWFAATRAEVPLIAIGQAGATMNLAYVRLGGRCTRAPSYDPESEYLSFWVEDDTGEICVVAYRAETRQIVEQGRVPAPGDRIEVAGTLRVREDFLTLTINVPEQLTVIRAEPVERAIGAITPKDEYSRVRVQGQVRQVYVPYEGLTLITIRDETGSIPVAVSEDLIALSGSMPVLTTGRSVEVVASVSLYGDAPQLVPASTADVVLLDYKVPIAVERFIVELTSADVDRTVMLHGALGRPEAFSQGVKFPLDDGTGFITLLLWQDVYDAIPCAEQLAAGAQVEVVGQIAEYQGELEIIPEKDGVRMVEIAVLAPTGIPLPMHTPKPTETPSPTVVSTSEPTSTPADTPTPTFTPIPEDTPTPIVELTPIEAITADRVGEVVTVEGTVVSAASLSAGFKFTLDDGTAQIVLLVWHEIYDDCWDALEINLGAKVRATGEIGQYEGELQMQPNFGGDVKAIEGAAAWAALREIGSLSGGDAGQRVMIEGTVIRVEGREGWAKVFVGDETGEVVVFLWRNLLDRIPDNTALGTEGSRVRVVGAVEVYRSNLEIAPTLPSDVMVLEVP